jgi:hypothetical protein
MHETIIEPFAGSASYSHQYADRKIVLVEKHHKISEMWRFLIAAKSSEILHIPLVSNLDDLPSWISNGARWLVGFHLDAASAAVARVYHRGPGWTATGRARVAAQVDCIRHWRIIEGDYSAAPDIKATWFIDPPYNNKGGSYYKFSSKQIDYSALGEWCRNRCGQVLVCENGAAYWLPFRPFLKLHKGINNPDETFEVLWHNVNHRVPEER